MPRRNKFSKVTALLLLATAAASSVLVACHIGVTEASAADPADYTAAELAPLPSMAPFNHGLNKIRPGVNDLILGRKLDDFQIFHDTNNIPQERAAVPFQYGYVDVPRTDGYSGGLIDPQDFDAIVARDQIEQVPGDVRLYVDGKGQAQIMQRSHPHTNARWDWDVTLPNAKPGIVIALWTFSGAAYLNPDKYQFEFDIEIMGGGNDGPRIEANFHDGKGSAINFGQIKGDWSNKRYQFSIDQRLDEGVCILYANGQEWARITRAEVEAAGRTWPTLPLYGVTDILMITLSPDRPGIREWAGNPDLKMARETLIVHGYQLTTHEAPGSEN